MVLGSRADGRRAVSRVRRLSAARTASPRARGDAAPASRPNTLQAAQRDELRAAVLADLGGPEQCSTAALAVVDRFCETSLIAELLFQHLADAGVLTRRGVRAALGSYLAVARSTGEARRTHRPTASAQRLGTLGDVQRAVEEANRR